MDQEVNEIISLCRQVWPDAFVIPLSQGPYGEPTMTGKEITREDWPLINLLDYLDRAYPAGPRKG